MKPMKLSWELSLFSAPSGPISSFIFIFLKEGTINCKTWKFTKLVIHQKKKTNNERVQGDGKAQLYQDRRGLGKAGTQSLRQFHFRSDFSDTEGR